MIESVVLAAHLREQLADESRRAFPRECCGLVEGVCDGSVARALALHATPNRAGEPDRFEIDPAAHIALLRGLRGSGRGIVGCYHSHPNGNLAPSQRDLETAADAGFLWLIAALSGRGGEPRIAAFAFTGSIFSPLRLQTSLS